MDLLQFRIHPSVGMARFGTSTESYFLGPEFPRFMQEQFPNLRHKSVPLRHPSSTASPASVASAEGRFRDTAGDVMPQAARFRIFAYAFNVGSREPYRVVEVTAADADIEWTVTVANRKTVRSATGKVELNDPAPVKMTTDPASSPTTCRKSVDFPNLAWLKLEDGTGRLHVIGNEGEDFNLQPSTPADAPRLFQLDWFDTAADGPVTAIVKPKASFLSKFAGYKYLVPGTKDPQTLPSGGTIEAVSAWVVINLPDFVPDMGHFVSLWDLVLAQTWKYVSDKNVTAVDGRHFLAVDSINDYAFYDYETHIHPLLVTFTDVNFTSGQSRNASGESSTHELGIVIKEKTTAPSVPPGVNVFSTSMRTGLRLLAAANMDPAAPPRTIAPFNITLTPVGTRPFAPGHEIVSCTKIGDDGKLEVTRGTTQETWDPDSTFYAAPKGTYFEAKLLEDIFDTETETVLKVEPDSAHRMRQPSAAAGDLNDGPFFIAITDLSSVEWVKCTKNDKREGHLTVVRGQLGTSRQSWDKDTTDLIAGGGGHKKYDVRTHMDKLARGARGPAHRRIFERLRLPFNLYQRTFPPLMLGGGPTDYPRQYGRRWNIEGPDGIDTVSGLAAVSETMVPPSSSVDPAGSLSPHWPKFNKFEGNACKADAMGSSDTVRMLDDMYWIATERDMPMLKDYAVTQLQYDQFQYWATATKTTGSKVRWEPLFTVLFRGTPIGAILRAGGRTLEQYFQEFARHLPRYTPAMLDMANMGKMLGGSFMPGIEVGREAGRTVNWSLTHGATKYFPDFRFHPAAGTTPHPPGMLTKDLAIPWFRDFISCDETYWPTSRPQVVYQEQGFAYQWLHGTIHDTHDYWRNVGFIRRSDASFVERERVLDVIT